MRINNWFDVYVSNWITNKGWNLQYNIAYWHCNYVWSTQDYFWKYLASENFSSYNVIVFKTNLMSTGLDTIGAIRLLSLKLACIGPIDFYKAQKKYIEYIEKTPKSIIFQKLYNNKRFTLGDNGVYDCMCNARDWRDYDWDDCYCVHEIKVRIHFVILYDLLTVKWHSNTIDYIEKIVSTTKITLIQKPYLINYCCAQ